MNAPASETALGSRYSTTGTHEKFLMRPTRKAIIRPRTPLPPRRPPRPTQNMWGIGTSDCRPRLRSDRKKVREHLDPPHPTAYGRRPAVPQNQYNKRRPRDKGRTTTDRHLIGRAGGSYRRHMNASSPTGIGLASSYRQEPERWRCTGDERAPDRRNTKAGLLPSGRSPAGSARWTEDQWAGPPSTLAASRETRDSRDLVEGVLPHQDRPRNLLKGPRPELPILLPKRKYIVDVNLNIEAYHYLPFSPQEKTEILPFSSYRPLCSERRSRPSGSKPVTE